MRPQDKKALDNLRLEGIKPGDIALRLHISPNTVRSYIRRHPEVNGAIRCKVCGKLTVQAMVGRTKQFCSDECRTRWWNSHQDSINKTAYYALTCQQCGKEFNSYGNKNRKFCCRECYVESRRVLQSRKSNTLPHLDGADREAG